MAAFLFSIARCATRARVILLAAGLSTACAAGTDGSAAGRVEETTTTTTAAAMPPTTTTTRPVTPEARLVGALREQGLMGAFERHGLTEDGLAGLFTDICGDFRRGRDPKSIYFGYRDELASGLPGIEARQIREAYAFAWASGGASFCPEHEDAIMQAPF